MIKELVIALFVILLLPTIASAAVEINCPDPLLPSSIVAGSTYTVPCSLNNDEGITKSIFVGLGIVENTTKFPVWMNDFSFTTTINSFPLSCIEKTNGTFFCCNSTEDNGYRLNPGISTLQFNMTSKPNLQPSEYIFTLSVFGGAPPLVEYVFSGRDWVGFGDRFYVDSKIADNVTDDDLKCLVKIIDDQGKVGYLVGNVTYDREIQKCKGFVTVNDTFHEGSATLVIDVWNSVGDFGIGNRATIIGIDNSRMIDISGIDTSRWYKGGDWLNSVTATVSSATFGDVEECLVDISSVSPEHTLKPSGNICIGNIKIPANMTYTYKTLTIKAININGRVVNDSVNIRIDNDLPAKDILSPVNDTYYSAEIPVIVNITDSLSGPKNGTYRIVKDPWRLFGLIPIPGTDYDSGWIQLEFNGTTWNDYFNTTPLISGETYYISVNVCDNAGNCVDPVIRFNIDKNPPNWSVDSGLIVTHSPYDKDGNILLSWPAATDDAAQIDHYNVYVYNSTGYLIFSDSIKGTSYEIFNLTDGAYSIKVTAVDKAQPIGNENLGLTGSTTVDKSCSVDGTCTPQAPQTGSVYTSGGSTSAEAGKCEENWNCNEWSDCADEKQTRTCTDLNNCNTTSSKPAELQTCSIPQVTNNETTPVVNETNAGTNQTATMPTGFFVLTPYLSNPIVMSLAAIVIIAIITVVMYSKKMFIFKRKIEIKEDQIEENQE